MSHPYRLLAAALLAVSLQAQDTLATVKGRLSDGSNSIAGGYVIELTNLTTRASIGRIEVGFGGEFTARHVPFGDYLARVTTYHGDTVAQQFVTVNQSMTQME